MVYFVCEHCSETLKKKAAETHFGCRPAKLTCVDCSKTFHGDAFREHTTCMSEEQKYQKTLYKGGKQKRDPQAEWNEAVAKAAASATKHRELLERLTGFPNVPRKLKPFVNFAKNSLRIFNDRILEELFGLVQAAAPPRPPQPQGKAEAADGEGDEAKEEAPAEPAPKAGQKRKREEDDDAAEQRTSGSSGAAAVAVATEDEEFDMKRFLVRALQEEPGQRLKAKRLKKKAVEAAVKAGRGSLTEDAAEAAYDKKIGRLMKKRRVVEDATGKFVQLVPQEVGGEGEEED